MAASTYIGPGEILFAPSALGDISLLRLGGQEQWSVGRGTLQHSRPLSKDSTQCLSDAFIACTQGVTKEYKSQGFSKAMFSGEGLFVYRISGTGILWFSSFGAILRKDVSA